MPVSLIAAVAAGNVIGNAGKLPWRLPDDLARFKRLTMGHPVVMGRKTFDAMGRPLSGRRNIVLTRDAGLALPGCEMAHSAAEVMDA
ncbi:MAG TPA: dihydrofolate reductase, partial [Spirochaetia bacterium]|nr:dihydrofolate reductase [Spirochaetia bacterium]